MRLLSEVLFTRRHNLCYPGYLISTHDPDFLSRIASAFVTLVSSRRNRNFDTLNPNIMTNIFIMVTSHESTFTGKLAIFQIAWQKIRGIRRWSVVSSHEWPVIRKAFSCHHIIICRRRLTHWGRDKWTPFRRRHFQMHFLEWKYLNSD